MSSSEASNKQKLLLHVCCAPCSPWVVEQLREQYTVTLYFYNPNIHPEEEYHKRLDELKDWAGSVDVPLIVEEYGVEGWFDATKGLEDAPERGERCNVCFDLRLGKVAKKAVELKMENFGTVLTVSPHKDAVVINKIGKAKGVEQKVTYFEADWKKKDGFKITGKMSREAGLYRQDYCGCVFSLRDRDSRRLEALKRQRID